MSRRKGARGEREAAALIAEHWHLEARRGRQFRGTDDSPDVICEALPGFQIECKWVEAFNAYAAIEQAATDGDGLRPLVCHKRNHRLPLLVLRFEDSLAFARALVAAVDKETP